MAAGFAVQLILTGWMIDGLPACLVDYAPKVEATLLHVGERLTASGVQKKGRHKDGPGTDNKEAESRTEQSGTRIQQEIEGV